LRSYFFALKGLRAKRSLKPCENTRMFTGIITGVGRIAALHDLGSSLDHGKRLTIEAPPGYLDDAGLGDSIALNGACMTVTSLDLPQQRFTIDISVESLERTSGLTDIGNRINLEKALRASDRLGGHIVSGHVDGIGEVTRFAQIGESWELRVMAPAELGKFLAFNGSITINGVSLTVNRVADSAEGCEFSINLIPHTVQNTALGQLQAGSRVNLEIDTVARYVERMLSSGQITPPSTAA
jgi:riboflavin synthase